MRAHCCSLLHMETETLTATVPTPLWGADRWLSWCDTCAAVTESDDTTCRWCLACGDRRND